MKIVHLVPGSGGTFYCENCLRDTSIVAALKARGHNVVMVPLYLPLFGHEPGEQGDTPIFFGGINTWLQEHVPPFRHTPRWMDRVFDSEPLLRAAASRAGSTSPKGLGSMTLSMLQGEEGHQAKELERLAGWLADEVRPDVIHLSNALLLGLARRLKERTGAAMVCTLQDEAPWIDAMEDDWPRRVWETLAERAESIDAFISVSRWYRDVIADRMKRAAEQVRVIPIGVDVDAYLPADPGSGPPVLGYLGRESEGEGLGILVEAFVGLRTASGYGDLRLRVTGGRTAEDAPLLEAVQRRLADAGAAAGAEFIADFRWESRREFLSSLSLLSVPGTVQTAFGLNILEALAAGVPVVQPRAGAFTELVETTGGGLLFEAGDTAALSAALNELIIDPERRRDLGSRGREGVRAHYSLADMAENLISLYDEVSLRG